MPSRTDYTRAEAPRGGPAPKHEELIIRGPFKGFDSDLDHYLQPDPTYADVIKNYDLREGHLKTRPGLKRVFRAIDSTLIGNGFADDGTDPSGVTDYSITAIYSRPDERLIEPWTIFAWGNYQVYYPGVTASDYKRFGDPPTTWERRFKLFTGANNATATGTAVSDSSGVNWDLVEINPSGNNAFPGSCFFRFTGGATADLAWRKITAISAASPGVLTVDTTYGAGPEVGTWEIAVPIYWETGHRESGYDQFGNVGTNAVQIPLAHPNEYYICGRAGGTKVTYNSTSYFEPASVTIAQPTTDLDHYEADDCAVYNNRLILATSRSWQHDDTAGGKTNRSDPAGKTDHPGRIAYSSIRNYYTFDYLADESAGYVDDIGATIGRIRHLFVLRDVLYAVSDSGIGAINKTGSAKYPFRGQVLMNDKKFVFRGKPKVVDGKFAIIGAADGVYRFDGSSIEQVSTPVQEEWIANIGHDASLPIATPNRMHFDDNRDRFFFAKPALSSAEEFYVWDIRTNHWTKYSAKESSQTGNDISHIAGLADWSSPDKTSNRGQFVECLAFTSDRADFSGDTIGDEVFQLDRRETTDFVGDGDEAEIDTEWFSKTIDMGDSRARKTLKRVRLTVENLSTTLNCDIDIEVYKDGGISAAETRTVRVSNITGAALNANVDVHATFSGVTGTDFRIRLVGHNGVTVDAHVVKQVAVTFLRRQEDRQM